MSYSNGLTYYDILEKNMRFSGPDPALIHNGVTVCHRDLFEDAMKLARGLSGLGLAPGDRVAVLSKNHPVFFHLAGAAAALNLTLVLINRRLTREEAAHVIEDTDPKVIIADDGMAEQAALTAEGESGRRYFVVEPRGGSRPDLSQLYNQGRLDRPADVSPDDPFIIIHTAAMSGKPKGAVLSHQNLILANMQLIREFDLDGDKTCLNVLPLFHIMGINLGFSVLQAGGVNVIQEKFDPAQALSLIETHRVNLTGSFPPMLTGLLDALEEGSYDISSLEAVVGMDQPDIVEKWETLSRSVFWTLYGQTETSGLITFAPYFSVKGSAGKVSLLAQIRTADDDGRFLPAGETGEILVKGPLVFKGYWSKGEIIPQCAAGGWHHTGDLGMLDDRGRLFFKGRKPEKELIKPGGENVFPAEVEAAILKHEAVSEACVFGVPDPDFGEGVKAVCVLHRGGSLTARELIDFTGTVIARYKKPRIVEFVSELPKTAGGAIDRLKVKKDYS